MDIKLVLDPSLQVLDSLLCIVNCNRSLITAASKNGEGAQPKSTLKVNYRTSPSLVLRTVDQ